jgi:tetratricopeptide (TPR) repeat protein
MNNYVVFCTNSGKLEEAKNILIQEVKTSPTPVKYVQLINLFKRLSDANSAETYTNEASAKYPNDFDVLVLSINNHIDKKNIDQAIAEIKIALKLNSNNNQLYLVLGQLYSDKEQYQEAIDAYQTGLKMFPEDYDLNYSLGRALFNKGTVIYNKHDESIKPLAIAALQESKKYFLKAKSINSTKVDIDKIIEDINSIK